MLRIRAAYWIVAALAVIAWSNAEAQLGASPSERPARPVAKPVAKCVATSAAVAAAAGASVTTTSAAGASVGYGAPIEVRWQLPAVARTTPVYLVGAMPDTVRFEGAYLIAEDGSLSGGPGFVALPGQARAPHGFTFGEGRTRVVIPIHDAETPRAGALRIKPYAAGTFAIEWAVVAVDPACKSNAAERVATRASGRLGPFVVAPGAPVTVVQDFITPDPALELATPDGAHKLLEVELSADGRHRLEIFPRRYRVFDRESGAKLVDRNGVKPRFSPGGRFVLASIGDAEKTYPTDLEVVDLVARQVVAKLNGPIVAWSNSDALLLDATNAYQGVWIFNALVDPVTAADGSVASWPYFSPGCSTCDAWVSSNIRIDWDRLSILRADGGSARAMGYVSMTTGTKVETTSFGDAEAVPLEAKLREIYGRRLVAVQKGWTSDMPLVLTHVGRGYNGYVDEEESLKPSEAGRKSALAFLAPRRLAIAEGRVLRAEDLKPAGGARGPAEIAPRRKTRGLPLEGAGIEDELQKLGLSLTGSHPVAEIAIPVEGDPAKHDPLVRAWPPALKAEVLAANPSLQSWFADPDIREMIVAAWRIEIEGARLLLLQHGEPAMTANGAHQLRFDVLALDGPAKGQLRTLEGIGGLFSQFVGRDHTVARVSLLSGKRLVVAVPSRGKGEIVALEGGAAARVIELQEPTVMCGFYEAGGGRLLVQSNCDGQMFVYEPEGQAKPILSGRVIDNELIVYTGDGFYASTYEGAHFVHVAFPGLPGVHSFEQYAKSLQRPDVIQAIIEGKPRAIPAPAITLPPEIDASFGGASSRQILARARSDVGIARIELYQDGRPVDHRQITGRSAEVSFDAEIPSHVRTLSLVAIDAKGVRSRPATLAAPPSHASRSNTLHVVAFGIDDYEQLAKLKGARLDAETIVSTLRASAPYYREVRATLRTDREVTPQAAMADLEQAIAASGPDDTVLVFFAGHGGRTDDGRYFLATSSSVSGRLPETAIDWQKASDLLGNAKGRVIAVLDACHSGQTGVAAVANDGAVASLATTPSAPIVILAASKGRQESEEMPSGEGGVFTQTLARMIGQNRHAADTDRDGILRVSELYRSLRQAVDVATSGRQTPWLVRRNVVGDAPLF